MLSPSVEFDIHCVAAERKTFRAGRIAFDAVWDVGAFSAAPPSGHIHLKRCPMKNAIIIEGERWYSAGTIVGR